MNETLLKLAAVAALAGALVAGGYVLGYSAATDHAMKKAQAAEKVAREAYAQDLQRGQQASAELVAARAVQDARYNALQGTVDAIKKRTRILVGDVPAVPSPAGAASGSAQNPAADPGREQLTAGAVWLWNSALAGADQRTGACGTADTSEASCAAATGITVGDAWDNHALNARQCADDRLNHQRLIDLVQRAHP